MSLKLVRFPQTYCRFSDHGECNNTEWVLPSYLPLRALCVWQVIFYGGSEVT